MDRALRDKHTSKRRNFDPPFPIFFFFTLSIASKCLKTCDNFASTLFKNLF